MTNEVTEVLRVDHLCGISQYSIPSLEYYRKVKEKPQILKSDIKGVNWFCSNGVNNIMGC